MIIWSFQKKYSSHFNTKKGQLKADIKKYLLFCISKLLFILSIYTQNICLYIKKCVLFTKLTRSKIYFESLNLSSLCSIYTRNPSINHTNKLIFINNFEIRIRVSLFWFKRFRFILYFIKRTRESISSSFWYLSYKKLLNIKMA